MIEPRVTLDENHFVRVDGICVARILGDYVEFVDKNKFRSNERGTRMVRIPIMVFVAHLLSFLPEKEPA